MNPPVLQEYTASSYTVAALRHLTILIDGRFPAMAMRFADSMHILMMIAVMMAALALLVLGLVGVLQDLLERGPYDAPLVEDAPCRQDPSVCAADG